MNLSSFLKDTFTGPCTLFPNGYWGECCEAHDYAFKYATVTRYQADEYLWYCMYEKTKSRTLAGLVFYGVRFFAWPCWFKHRLDDFLTEKFIGDL